MIAGQVDAPMRHEIELRRPDSALVPLRITAWALEAGDGTRLGCIAACEDLSAARALEAGLRQADRLATLGRMAANIAHEIRNPLASLSGAVETHDPRRRRGGKTSALRDRRARITTPE